MRRVVRWLGWGLLALVAVVAQRLAAGQLPGAAGHWTPSHALPLQPAQTEIDRELSPLLRIIPARPARFPDRRARCIRSAGNLRAQGRPQPRPAVLHLAQRPHRPPAGSEAWRGRARRARADPARRHERRRPGSAPAGDGCAPGIELRLYNPFRNRGGAVRAFELLRRMVSMNHRMHNKAWIADGRVAIIGGRNIGERVFQRRLGRELPRPRPAVARAGSAAGQHHLRAYWNSAAAVPIATLSRKDPEALRA